MQIKSAEFLSGTHQVSLCPPPTLPEVAFIGRSNVGKSSLINMLVQRNGLAKTSGTPGKTQAINHFIVNEAWYLVDLPGYGWAKVGRDERAKYRKMVEDYLRMRQNLLATFVLIDSRHTPQAVDLQFMEWLAEKEIPFAMVFTKTDKLPTTKVEGTINAYLDKMREVWDEVPKYFVTSAEMGRGREELLGFVEHVMEAFEDFQGAP